MKTSRIFFLFHRKNKPIYIDSTTTVTNVHLCTQSTRPCDHLSQTQNHSLFKSDDIHSGLASTCVICRRTKASSLFYLPILRSFRDQSIVEWHGKDHRIGGEQKMGKSMKTNKRERQKTNECNERERTRLPYTHYDGLENQSMNPFC